MGNKTNNNNVAGTTDRRRWDCECVYECLLELLADALGENNHCHRDCCKRRCDCNCVYECLFELLSDALEEENHHHKCPR